MSSSRTERAADVTAYVAVVGAGVATSVEADVAEDVGRLLAQAGCVVVTGGLGGVMEAAARGAASVGGVTVGLLPGTDRQDANPFVTVSIPTGLGELRNGLIVRAADAVIAVGGEHGTLSEIALALKRGIPVVGIRTWSLSRHDGGKDVIDRADTAEDAVRQVMRRIGRT